MSLELLPFALIALSSRSSWSRRRTRFWWL